MPTRRTFLRMIACAAPAPLWGVELSRPADAAPRAKYWVSGASAGGDCGACHLQPAALDRRHVHARTTVLCQLCAQRCTIKAGARGRCRVRENVGGELRSLSYGRPLAVHVDPIEKKPFYHFLPGSNALSFGTVGCPLRCQFCQNWEISQASPEDFDVPLVGAGQVVDAASCDLGDAAQDGPHFGAAGGPVE